MGENWLAQVDADWMVMLVLMVWMLGFLYGAYGIAWLVIRVQDRRRERILSQSWPLPRLERR